MPLRPATAPSPGQPCAVAVVRDDAPRVAIVGGTIAAAAEAESASRSTSSAGCGRNSTASRLARGGPRGRAARHRRADRDEPLRRRASGRPPSTASSSVRRRGGPVPSLSPSASAALARDRDRGRPASAADGHARRAREPFGAPTAMLIGALRVSAASEARTSRTTSSTSSSRASPARDRISTLAIAESVVRALGGLEPGYSGGHLGDGAIAAQPPLAPHAGGRRVAPRACGRPRSICATCWRSRWPSPRTPSSGPLRRARRAAGRAQGRAARRCRAAGAGRAGRGLGCELISGAGAGAPSSSPAASRPTSSTPRGDRPRARPAGRPRLRDDVRHRHRRPDDADAAVGRPVRRVGLGQELLHGAAARADRGAGAVDGRARTAATSSRSASTPGTTPTATCGRASATRSSSSSPEPGESAERGGRGCARSSPSGCIARKELEAATERAAGRRPFGFATELDAAIGRATSAERGPRAGRGGSPPSGRQLEEGLAGLGVQRRGGAGAAAGGGAPGRRRGRRLIRRLGRAARALLVAVAAAVPSSPPRRVVAQDRLAAPGVAAVAAASRAVVAASRGAARSGLRRPARASRDGCATRRERGGRASELTALRQAEAERGRRAQLDEVVRAHRALNHELAELARASGSTASWPSGRRATTTAAASA